MLYGPVMPADAAKGSVMDDSHADIVWVEDKTVATAAASRPKFGNRQRLSLRAGRLASLITGDTAQLYHSMPPWTHMCHHLTDLNLL